MKTNHKYVTFNEKRNLYVFHYVIRENGKVVQQVNRTAKTESEILSIRNEYMRLKGMSVELMKEYDYAVSPIKEKPITIPLFGEGFRYWCLNVISLEIRSSSMSTYHSAINKILPFIGYVPIDKVTKQLLQEMFLTLQYSDNLSSGYVRKLISCVSRYFLYEIGNGRIKENPCHDIKIKSTQGRIIRAFTQQEKLKFLLVCRNELGYMWYLLYYMYFQTGCRRGELAAVKWKDIDFKKGYLHITKTISKDRINGGECVGEPKTPQSKRIVPLRKNLLDALKKQKGNADDYIFSCDTVKPISGGKWVSVSQITENFIMIRKKAGLSDELTLHSTRKTFASELLLKGVPIPTVKMLGGWNSTNVLLKHYAFSDIDNMVKAIRGTF